MFYFLSLHCKNLFVTGKNNHMAGMEAHIASPPQSAVQLNSPILDRANSSVLDESPVFSNQNVGESGNSLGLAYIQINPCNILCKHRNFYSCFVLFLVLEKRMQGIPL